MFVEWSHKIKCIHRTKLHILKTGFYKFHKNLFPRVLMKPQLEWILFSFEINYYRFQVRGTCISYWIGSNYNFKVLFALQDETNTGLSSRIKELEEERGRLHRTNASQQSQMDKYKKMAEEARSKSESMEGQLTAVRKVRRNRK